MLDQRPDYSQMILKKSFIITRVLDSEIPPRCQNSRSRTQLLGEFHYPTLVIMNDYINMLPISILHVI